MKKALALLTLLAAGVVAFAQYTPDFREAEAVNSTETVTTTITAVGGIHEITAATAVTNATLVAPGGEGIRTTVVNVGTNAITILDSATIQGTGQLALGQYDTISLISIDGTAWVETGKSDN